jgi:beta-lactamase regulating signal transducer with metallopeptidase domain
MPTFPEAILNGWWQGIALTLVVWAVMRGQTRISAATRLAIWQVTMAVVVLLPLLQVVPWPEMAAKRVAVAPVAEDVRSGAPVVAEPAPAIASEQAVVQLDNDEPLKVLVVVGGLLAAFQLLRLVIGYLVVFRLKRKSVASGVTLPRSLERDARILLSSRISMPLAVGYRNPAILLPERMIRALSAEQIEQVVLHEAAHLQRRDDWFGLMERVVRAVFFVQPAIWFIGIQIERERELACDDWVVAQSGEPKIYASALARVAEVGTNGWVPMLATGAGKRKEIFTRMEALLDQTRNKIPSASGPMVLAAALLLLFVVTQAAPFSRLFGFSSYDSRSVVDDGNTRREFSLKGDVEFSEDEQDVLAVAPGARLLLSRSEGWNARRVEIEADEDGRMVKRYFVGGVAQPYGAEAKRFLARELPAWMKNQPRNLQSRVARWMQNEGIEGALREVEGAINGGVKREYLEELLRGSSLDTVQLRRWMRIAEQLDSDGDKERLVELVSRQAKSLGMEASVIELIQKMHSDDDRGRLLEGMLHDVEDATLPRLLRAISQMHNEDRKCDLLDQTAKSLKRDLPLTFFEVTKGIHSDESRRRVLLSALEHHGAEILTQQQVVAQGGRMHSGETKRSVMIAVLDQKQVAPEVLADVKKVAEHMHSDEDRDAVMKSLNSR